MPCQLITVKCLPEGYRDVNAPRYTPDRVNPIFEPVGRKYQQSLEVVSRIVSDKE